MKQLTSFSIPLAAAYLRKIDQCARLANASTDPPERSKYLSERNSWMQILADEIGTEVRLLEDALALLLPEDLH